jgi:hypothetical protein
LNEAAIAAGAGVGVTGLLSERMWVLEPTPQTGVSEMAEISPLRRRMIEDMTVRNMLPIPTKPPGCNGIMPPGIPE